MDYEEVEDIPWSSLVVSDEQRRPSVAVVAVGALVVFVVGIVVIRALLGSGPADLPQVDVSTLAPVVGSTSVEVDAVEPSTESRLLSEADLMAVLPAEQSRAAAAAAEQFVFDYFTIDGESGRIEALVAALPSSITIPHGDAADVISYVEWVEAIHVTPLDIDEYSVTVAYRMLSGDGGVFGRQPAMAVDVRVGVDGRGGVLVLDLPAPAVLTRASLNVPAYTESVLPPVVTEGALREAWDWGDLPAVLYGGKTDGVYRVVVTARDRGGVSWPLTVWLDETGSRIIPPPVSVSTGS